MTAQQMITSNSPVLASSFQAGSSKYCRASRAQKWLYLSWNNSESSDSSCVGFPAGPTIVRKLSLLSLYTILTTITPQGLLKTLPNLWADLCSSVHTQYTTHAQTHAKG